MRCPGLACREPLPPSMDPASQPPPEASLEAMEALPDWTLPRTPSPSMDPFSSPERPKDPFSSPASPEDNDTQWTMSQVEEMRKAKDARTRKRKREAGIEVASPELDDDDGDGDDKQKGDDDGDDDDKQKRREFLKVLDVLDPEVHKMVWFKDTLWMASVDGTWFETRISRPLDDDIRALLLEPPKP